MKHELLGNNAQFVKFPFEDFIKGQIKNSISAVDLTLMTPHIYIDSEECIDFMGISSILKNAGIDIHTVTPMPYRYSICSSENSIQNIKTVEYYKQCILFAESVGANYVIITASGANYDVPSEQLMENGKKTLVKIASIAEEHGRTLLLGSVLGEESPYNATTPVMVTLGQVAEVIHDVNSPALKSYIDVEAISLVGETITEWFKKLGDDIKLIRFTDGNYNGYRIWGKGCLPCEKLYREICKNGYTGPLSLQIPGERYSDYPLEAETEMVAYLKNVMEKVVR